MRIGIALINLDRDGLRLDHMRDELGRAGLAFERFPAILGLAVPDELRALFLDASGVPLSRLKPGEIGVYASHLALHRQLLARSDLDALVVMEDDLEVSPDLGAVLAGLAALEEPVDIVRLSNPAKEPALDHGEVTPGRSLVTYWRVPNNMGCYLITKSGAAKTTAMPAPRFAIDEDMRRPWEIGLETFGVLPAPVRANIFDRSSIDAMGDRGLGRESTLEKLRRRHRPTLAQIAAYWRWQIARFGAAGTIRALAGSAVTSLLKRARGNSAPPRLPGRPIRRREG
jgi:glycosyl transferase family 25